MCSTEPQGRAPDRVDPFERAKSEIGHVIDNLWREDLSKPVQVTAVEQVSVQRQGLCDRPAIFGV